MLNYKKINDLHLDRNINKMDFYSKIDMTASGFLKMMEHKRMKVETLEKIAEYFKKPISYFFDEEPGTILIAGPAENHGTDYKALYLQTLEKYTLCLEENKSLSEPKPGKGKPANKPVHKS